MKEPIKSGDKCEVIQGLGRGKSPNIGLEVTVGKMQGEHSVHGMCARCTGPDVVQLGDAGNYVVTGWADFPLAWLRKIDETKPDTGVTTKKEITA